MSFNTGDLQVPGRQEREEPERVAGRVMKWPVALLGWEVCTPLSTSTSAGCWAC